MRKYVFLLLSIFLMFSMTLTAFAESSSVVTESSVQEVLSDSDSSQTISNIFSGVLNAIQELVKNPVISIILIFTVVVPLSFMILICVFKALR